MPQPLSDIEKANLRIKCADIAITNGTKVDMTKDACLEVAKKIYAFAIGTTEQKAPDAGEGTG